MGQEILVCCKSVTGFTWRYAERIAGELGCPLMDLQDVTAEKASQYGIVAFGGRFHAGRVDGLRRARVLAAKAGASLAVFATGAAPASAEETIRQAWANNLTAEELERVPHVYLPGGLCYERMPLADRLMMRVFTAGMRSRLKKEKNQTEENREMCRMIASSYDISSEEYIWPLVDCLREMREEKGQ